MTLKLRKATRCDDTAMAELINFAGEGMPLYLWEKMAEDGETAWDVGRRRAQREEGSFSYVNTTLAELDGDVVASLIGYRLGDEPEEIDYDTFPAMFVPLQELENIVPGSWYVNVLATYPEHRSKGIGSKLLDHAGELARISGAASLSIIVADANKGARGLYERCGYAEVAMRPMVHDDWENESEHWVLLTKALD